MHLPFAVIVLGSAVCDILVAGFFLVRAGRRARRESAGPVGLRHLARSALATALVLAPKLLALRAAGVRDFGVVHLVYVDLVVLFPLVGLGLLVSAMASPAAARWKLTAPARVAAWASLAAVPIGVYATCVEPFRLQVEEVRVATPPRRAGHAAVRVAVLSDLQTRRVTDYERSAVARLMAQSPDIIVLPGDVFQGRAEEFEATRYELKDLLEQLSAPGGVYLVLGDTDGNGAHLDAILHSSRVRILRNELAHTTVRDRAVTIGGVSLDVKSPAARDLIARLEQAPGEEDVRILLAHRPDVVFELRPASRIDLVVAGHTHGGQVVLPGYGPPLTLTRVPRAVAAGGLHRVGGHAVYVSRGVGCERGQAPRIRFLCPPEISLLELGARRDP